MLRLHVMCSMFSAEVSSRSTMPSTLASDSFFTRYLYTLCRLSVLRVFRMCEVILGRSEFGAGTKWNLKMSSPASTFIFYALRMRSSLALSFLHPVMFTVFRFRQTATISERATPVMLVLPRSNSSKCGSCLTSSTMPSSFKYAQPRKQTFRSNVHVPSLLAPTSVTFRHSAREITSSPRDPLWQMCATIFRKSSALKLP